MNILHDCIARNPFAKLMPEGFGVDHDMLRVVTPQALHTGYSTGRIMGALVDTDNSPWYVRQYVQYNRDFLARNQEDGHSIIFEDTPYYSKIKGLGAGKRLLPYHKYLQLDPEKAMRGAQATGDCVSWGIRTALDILRAINVFLKGERYICRQATAGIYSGRGHTGQGADPVALSAWAIKIGTLLEQEYKTSSNTYDFRDYKSYVRWGMSRGRIGMPEDLLELTKPYTADSYKIVRTTEAARDIMAAGGSIHCGSGLGVSSQGNPISRRSGSWAHDMAVPGFDDTREFFNFCVWCWDQSWGQWNTVTNIPEAWKPHPEGMFYLDDSTTQGAFSGGGACAFLPGRWFAPEGIFHGI